MYVIAEPCVDVKDRACTEECPVDCIYEGVRMLYIHPDECVDCGACEPVCPVEAIFYEDDLPEEWSDYHAANVEFFNDLGSPRSLEPLGDPAVTGIAAETAGHRELRPGSVAVFHGVPGRDSWLCRTLLLFFDRVLVLCDDSASAARWEPSTLQLCELGLLEAAPVDLWAWQLGAQLAQTCEFLAESGPPGRNYREQRRAGSRHPQLFARLRDLLESQPPDAPASWDPGRYPEAPAILPQLMRFLARWPGLEFEPVVANKSALAGVRSLCSQQPDRTVVHGSENVLPRLGELAVGELLDFRSDHQPLFRAHLDLVRRAVAQAVSPGLPRAESGTAAARDVAEEVAESAYRLRVAARRLPASNYGVTALGALAEPAGPPLDDCAGPGRKALARCAPTAAQTDPEIFSWVVTPPVTPEWMAD